MSVVTLAGVSKSFGSVDVLHDLNAEVGEGEFVAILGESGCGKSTLLRIIAGLEDATEGEILINGTIVNDLTPRERNIAMVFQSYALYPHMTVEQNISFPLQLSGVDSAEQKRKTNQAAEMLNLTDYLKRKPRDLSGGQRQRVAMGRALVRNPQVFLFDEPLSNLDAKLRVQMRSDIRNLQQKLQKTTVYVTHDQIEAMTMADRVMLMNDGRIEQFGAPLDLYDRPANQFVAAFVGSPAINFIKGEGRDRSFFGEAIGQALNIESLPDQTATVGIRPEHFSIARGDKPNGLTGRVTSLECTGDRTFLEVEVGRSILRATSAERCNFNVGDIVTLFCPAEKYHFFGADQFRVQ